MDITVIIDVILVVEGVVPLKVVVCGHVYRPENTLLPQVPHEELETD